jgi:uncharacterized protein (DUF433 family)
MRRIVSDQRVLGGKPVVEGTRMSVEQILGLLAKGMTAEALCEAYPVLAPEDVRVALAWAQAALKNDVVVDLPHG